MNRLDKLIQDHTFGTINESDYSEMADLFIKDKIDMQSRVKFYGEQLTFLMNKTVKSNKTKRVS